MWNLCHYYLIDMYTESCKPHTHTLEAALSDILLSSLLLNNLRSFLFIIAIIAIYKRDSVREFCVAGLLEVESLEWHKNCAKIKSECALQGTRKFLLIFNFIAASLHHHLLLLLLSIVLAPLFYISASHSIFLIARGALLSLNLCWTWSEFVGKISKDRGRATEEERIAENPRLLLIPFDSC